MGEFKIPVKFKDKDGKLTGETANQTVIVDEAVSDVITINIPGRSPFVVIRDATSGKYMLHSDNMDNCYKGLLGMEGVVDLPIKKIKLDASGNFTITLEGTDKKIEIGPNKVVSTDTSTKEAKRIFTGKSEDKLIGITLPNNILDLAQNTGDIMEFTSMPTQLEDSFFPVFTPGTSANPEQCPFNPNVYRYTLDNVRTNTGTGAPRRLTVIQVREPGSGNILANYFANGSSFTRIEDPTPLTNAEEKDDTGVIVGPGHSRLINPDAKDWALFFTGKDHKNNGVILQIENTPVDPTAPPSPDADKNHDELRKLFHFLNPSLTPVVFEDHKNIMKGVRPKDLQKKAEKTKQAQDSIEEDKFEPPPPPPPEEPGEEEKLNDFWKFLAQAGGFIMLLFAFIPGLNLIAPYLIVGWLLASTSAEVIEAGLKAGKYLPKIKTKEEKKEEIEKAREEKRNELAKEKEELLEKIEALENNPNRTPEEENELAELKEKLKENEFHTRLLDGSEVETHQKDNQTANNIKFDIDEETESLKALKWEDRKKELEDKLAAGGTLTSKENKELKKLTQLINKEKPSDKTKREEKINNIEHTINEKKQKLANLMEKNPFVKIEKLGTLINKQATKEKEMEELEAKLKGAIKKKEKEKIEKEIASKKKEIEEIKEEKKLFDIKGPQPLAYISKDKATREVSEKQASIIKEIEQVKEPAGKSTDMKFVDAALVLDPAKPLSNPNSIEAKLKAQIEKRDSEAKTALVNATTLTKPDEIQKEIDHLGGLEAGAPEKTATVASIEAKQSALKSSFESDVRPKRKQAEILASTLRNHRDSEIVAKRLEQQNQKDTSTTSYDAITAVEGITPGMSVKERGKIADKLTAKGTALTEKITETTATLSRTSTVATALTELKSLAGKPVGTAYTPTEEITYSNQITTITNYLDGFDFDGKGGVTASGASKIDVRTLGADEKARIMNIKILASQLTAAPTPSAAFHSAIGEDLSLIVEANHASFKTAETAYTNMKAAQEVDMKAVTDAQVIQSALYGGTSPTTPIVTSRGTETLEDAIKRLKTDSSERVKESKEKLEGMKNIKSSRELKREAELNTDATTFKGK